jgi:hypothetical protein
MTQCLTENFEFFREAILKTASENPELVPPTAHPIEDFADTAGALLADGDCGWITFLAGREFAGKLLENIVDAEDYEVCIALRESIKAGVSIYDNEGSASASFTTPTREAWLASSSNATP